MVYCKNLYCIILNPIYMIFSKKLNSYVLSSVESNKGIISYDFIR